MKIFTTEQVKMLDGYTIEHEPISSVDLMERAASELTSWIVKHFSERSTVAVCCGTGSNGGDGMAVARMLAIQGYKVEVCLLAEPSMLSSDAKVNYQRLADLGVVGIKVFDGSLILDEEGVVIDALFGSGLNRALAGNATQLVECINRSRATVIAIDLPSGLLGEKPHSSPAIVKAAYTLALQFPKLSLLYPENGDYVGKLEIIPIGIHAAALSSTPTFYHYLEEGEVKRFLAKRKTYSHKGTYGSCLLVAGSYGMAGAAVLSARACYRSGVGLLTVHVPGSIVNVTQSCVPEAIAHVDTCLTHVTNIGEGCYAAVAFGSGIAQHADTQKAMHRLIGWNKNPLVVDADGLNILARNKSWLSLLPSNTILTPHPKEFERLAGGWANDYERLQLLCSFAKQYNVIVVLKGAHTTVALPSGEVWFNSTGNPGMATAGSGDVLTGILLALLGQGLEPFKAALLGVYVHGLAGDLASESLGEVSVVASDLVKYLPKAFQRAYNM